MDTIVQHTSVVPLSIRSILIRLLEYAGPAKDNSRTETSSAHKVSRNAQLILQKHIATIRNTRIRHHTSMFVYDVLSLPRSGRKISFHASTSTMERVTLLRHIKINSPTALLDYLP